MVGRQQLTFFDPRDDVVDYVSVGAVPLLVGWLAMLLAVGGYARDIFGAGTEEYKLVVKASLLSAGLVGIGCYLTGFPLSRGFFLLVFTIGTPLLILWRFVFRRSIQHTRRHGHLREGVIIAGNPQHVDEVAAVLRRESWLGYTVLGALTTPGTRLVETPAGIPVLGDTTDTAAAIRGSGRRRHRLRRGCVRQLQGAAPRDVGARGPLRPGHRRPEPDRRLAASGSRSARSRVCRWCTSSRRVRCTPRTGPSASSTSRARCSCWSCSRPS